METGVYSSVPPRRTREMADSRDPDAVPRASRGARCHAPKGPVPRALFPFDPRRLASTIRTQDEHAGRGINHQALAEPTIRRPRGGDGSCTRTKQ